MAAFRKIIPARVSHVFSSDSGTIGQGVRYAMSGGVVALVYLTMTTVLAEVASVPFQLALILGFATSTLVHFTLQRTFVWMHRSRFALDARSQAMRYLPIIAIQYPLMAASTSLLPGALDVSPTYVLFATAAAIAMTNFLLFRGRVFHSEA